MTEKISYEIIQIATEEFYGKKDIVTEVRFYHVLEDVKRLYVAHLLYENDEPLVTLSDVYSKGKEMLIPYIEDSLGKDQIEHMEKLLLEDLQKQKNPVTSRQYFNI